MKVVFLLRSLNRGGAERQLTALSAGLHERGHDIEVVTFYPGGPYAAELADRGVRVSSLDKTGRWDSWGFAKRLRRHLALAKPDVVHGYLTEPNVATAVAHTLGSRPRVVWGVRASAAPPASLDRATRLARRIEFPLARLADLVIANSRAGRAHAIAGGAPAARTVVIENGIDTREFRPLPDARAPVRAAWGVPASATVIGIVSRFAPMKDYPLFIDAAALAAAREPRLRFVCAGHGEAGYVAGLRARARAAGVDERITWLDAGADAAPLYAGFDLYTSTSAWGEGFSNSIAEAMACGLHCVVTDVGDSARIVGPLGTALRRPTPAALADAWLEALSTGLAPPLGDHRDRIEREFALPTLVSRTERTLERLLEGLDPTVPGG